MTVREVDLLLMHNQTYAAEYARLISTQIAGQSS